MKSDVEKRAVLIDRLSTAGFLAPHEEADALLKAAEAGVAPVEALLERRIAGEPLAWIQGFVIFCGLQIHVDPGVFVPRPHSEWIAKRAIELLEPTCVAVDFCTGSGAIAAVVARARPDATVIATDIDPASVACAQQNGVHALEGDLDEPLPQDLFGAVDVVTGVVPYVPAEEFHLLPRDVVAHEPRLALDGGAGGTRLLARAADTATRLLRPEGHLLLELGGDQAEPMRVELDRLGFTDIRVHADEEGQDRAIEARWSPALSHPSGTVRHRDDEPHRGHADG